MSRIRIRSVSLAMAAVFAAGAVASIAPGVAADAGPRPHKAILKAIL